MPRPGEDSSTADRLDLCAQLLTRVLPKSYDKFY